jgi:hypothetical protein
MEAIYFLASVESRIVPVILSEMEPFIILSDILVEHSHKEVFIV